MCPLLAEMLNPIDTKIKFLLLLLCAAGFAKVQPFTRVNFADFVTLHQNTLSIFCYYHFCPLKLAILLNGTLMILDQFSMITRPYPRVNGLKPIPFPAAHTRIANIWKYPFPSSRVYTKPVLEIS